MLVDGRGAISHAPFSSAERDDAGHLQVDFGARAVEFDQQQAASHCGIVGVDGGFGGLDGEAVHHLHGGGKHAGGDDVG